jgi:radical SAM/Cys-rich protein
LLKRLDEEYTQVVFPTDAMVLQAGSLVAVSFVYHHASRRGTLSHCLCAGAETEIQFLKGDVAFGLPRPQPGDAGDGALANYRWWRRWAWSKFWTDDLESGPAVASENWLARFWTALEALFGGNDLPRPAAKGASSAVHVLPGMTQGDTVAPVFPPQALENIGGRCFTGHAAHGEAGGLRALELSTLMVNLGKRCNQACRHCHVDAGPHRTEEMSRETVEQVLHALRRCHIGTLDITGGAPELNPHFRYLASEARELGCHVIDRCNLTILFEPEQEDLPEFLAKHGIHVTASLPSDQADIADRQRGVGSFAKSIAALRKLNELGYGRPDSGLILNLVYNPSGTEYPPPQQELERRFQRELADRHGVTFNRLLAMNNMPINRFAEYLDQQGQCAAYLDGLARAFNADTVTGLMCRHTLSVGWDGRLYDCDFNQVVEIPLVHGLPTHVRDLNAATLRHREINTANHCFGCAAGTGSSCNGALVATVGLPRANTNGNGRTPVEIGREVRP